MSGCYFYVTCDFQSEPTLYDMPEYEGARSRRHI